MRFTNRPRRTYAPSARTSDLTRRDCSTGRESPRAPLRGIMETHMARKRHRPCRILAKPRDADVPMAQGASLADVIRMLDVSAQT